LRQYVALTDDESDSISDLPQREDESAVSSDSGPLSVDLPRIGIPREVEEDSDVSFDRFSAATDMGSELFHVLDSPHKGKGRFHEARHGMGGCTFWVTMHKEEDVRRKKARPPLRPVLPPRKVPPQIPGGGRWPFNAKSERRLPWDKEPAKVDEPAWRKPPPRERAFKRVH
jgi:hypothetical protein